VYAEARAVLRAVPMDLFFICWCFETRSDNRIRHVIFEVLTAVTTTMTYSGMLPRVALVRAGVSEVCSASIIRVTRFSELGTLAVISN
jgi:hypothetical protein